MCIRDRSVPLEQQEIEPTARATKAALLNLFKIIDVKFRNY